MATTNPVSTSTTSPLTGSSNATSALARELVDLCRLGRNGDAIEKLYAEKVVSIEPVGGADMPAQMEGIEAVRGKHHWWNENMVVHSAEVRGPFVGDDNEFAVYFDYDTTFKPTGKRGTMREMARYTVADGKIVREEFFYAPES
jgi:SnoaL-like domain